MPEKAILAIEQKSQEALIDQSPGAPTGSGPQTPTGSGLETPTGSGPETLILYTGELNTSIDHEISSHSLALPKTGMDSEGEVKLNSQDVKVEDLAKAALVKHVHKPDTVTALEYVWKGKCGEKFVHLTSTDRGKLGHIQKACQPGKRPWVLADAVLEPAA